jgi:hypothetical protein
MKAALGLVVLALVAAACVDLNTQDNTVTTWQAQLAPDISHPDLAGQVAAAVQLGGTDVGIGISGAAAGAAHVWGLWSGTCRAPRTLLGTDTDYPVLAVGDSGKASAETRLGIRLSTDSTYHAELRQSVTDSTRIACGELLQL